MIGVLFLPQPARRPNVAIVPEWYPSVHRPVLGTFVRDQARSIAPHANVTVLYADPDLEPRRGRWSFEEERDGDVRVIRIALAKLRPRQLGTILRCRALERVVATAMAGEAAPDVFHAHVFSAGLPALAVARRRGVPVVVSEHSTALGTRALSRWDRFVARQVFGRADMACPVSDELGTRIATLAPAARIVQVPNGVDTSLFRPDGLFVGGPRSDPRLLAVGLLRPVKGMGELLAALPAVRHRYPDVHLDLVGDGPELASLRRQAAAAGLQDNVVFHGRLDKAEVADLMRRADLFVLPSLWENLPCVVIEALASGLPVVGTKVGGVPELVDEGGGLLVEPGDREALAEAIGAALDDLGRWDRAGLSRAARASYSLEATGSRWLDVYRRVIAGAR